MTDTTCLQAALAYAREFGWAVFPLHSVDQAGHCSCHRGADCERAGKHPRTREGLKEATTEARTIRSWWVQWPDANLAVATGPGSGIDVLDVDPRHGGDDSLETLKAEYGPLPATAEQHTGGGGRHLVFQHHEGVRNKAGLAPGLDVRGEGGYVVVPPSSHASGRPYVWELSSRPGQVEPAAWPPWLLEQILHGRRDQAAGAERLAPLADKVPAGERNETLFRHACKMRGQGLSPDAIRAALVVENQRCDPPLPDPEIASIAASAGRYTPSGGNGHPPGASPGGNGRIPDGPSDATALPAACFARTHIGNAERLVARHGAKLRYCELWKTYLAWDGCRWMDGVMRPATHLVHQWTIDTVRSIYREAADAPDDVERKALAKWAHASESGPNRDHVIGTARRLPGMQITPGDLDADPYKLTVANGTLDLRTGRLGPFRREDFITKWTPVEYDAEARCPLWHRFLQRIFENHPALIPYLQRAVGYSLTGSTDEQVLFLLYGTGENGKSKFIETLAALLGDYAQTASFDTFLQKDYASEARNDIARMAGMRLVVASEGERGKRMAESVVKQLTGGDRVTARFFHREFFDFTPEFKLWLGANHKPEIRGTDHGIWRRIKLVPFAVTIPPAERDNQMGEKLKRELPGILAWAVEGCLAWQREGLAEPEEVQEATADYRGEMDILAGFLAACCQLRPEARTKASELHQAYQAYCERSHEDAVKSRTFSSLLLERGFQRLPRSQYGVFYQGIELVYDQIQV